MKTKSSSTLNLMKMVLDDPRFDKMKNQTDEQAADACFRRGVEIIDKELSKPLSSSLILGRGIFYLVVYVMLLEYDDNEENKELDSLVVDTLYDYLETKINNLN